MSTAAAGTWASRCQRSCPTSASRQGDSGAEPGRALAPDRSGTTRSRTRRCSSLGVPGLFDRPFDSAAAQCLGRQGRTTAAACQSASAIVGAHGRDRDPRRQPDAHRRSGRAVLEPHEHDRGAGVRARPDRDPDLDRERRPRIHHAGVRVQPGRAARSWASCCRGRRLRGRLRDRSLLRRQGARGDPRTSLGSGF